jgi:hypothetical protein
MRHHSVRRCALVVCAATALLANGPAAHAAQSIGNPLGGGILDTELGHTLWAAVQVTPVPSSLNGYSVAVTCTVTSGPDAASTAVDHCSLDGVEAPAIALSGDAAATGTVLTAFRNTWGYACVQGSAVFMENVVGPSSITGSTGCYWVYFA